MWPVLLAILLALVAVAVLPNFAHMRKFDLGYFPTGAILLLMTVLVILMLFGKP